MGMLLALLERARSGEGQWVHTSLLESQIAMLDFQAARWLIDKDVAAQAGNDHPTGIPMGVFPTSDGAINIAAAGQVLWQRLLGVIDAAELGEDERFATAGVRSDNRGELNKLLSEITVTRTSAEWIEILNEAGVPCGPINSIDQTFADPQVQHLGIAYPMNHPTLGEQRIVGQAVTLTRTPQPPEARLATPDLGQQTNEVLGELGFDADAIAGLKVRGVI